MATDEKKIQIIGNESNHVFEIEPGGTPHGPEPNTTAEKVREKEQLAATFSETGTPRTNDEIANNDGSLIETLDTAFHNKPGVAEGTNESGSNRAGYYEERSQGKTDAEEELEMGGDE